MNSKDGKVHIFLLLLAAFFSIIIFLAIFLKFPAVQQFYLIIGVTIINCVSVAVTVISTLQRTRKKLRLEYHVNDDAPLMTATKGTEAPNVDAIFKGKKKGSLYLVTVKIQNSGNTSITPKDFTKELELNFGDKAEILKVDVLEKRPSGRKIEFMTDDHELFIEPMLLNRKDEVTLAVLLKGVVDKVALITNVQGTIPEVLKR